MESRQGVGGAEFLTDDTATFTKKCDLDGSCIVVMKNNRICVVLESPHGVESQIQRYTVGVLGARGERSCALERSKICGSGLKDRLVLVWDNWRITSFC